MPELDLTQDLARQLSTLSAEQAEAAREFLQTLSGISSAPEAQTQQYLTFLCCGQTFGISIRQIIQILQIPPITPLPDSPPYMKGVISIRGEMVPVIDLRMRFGKSDAAYDAKSCIIIIRIQGNSFGIIVDSVSNVETIAPEEICQPPQQESRPISYLTGIVQRDCVILLLNTDDLLTAHDLDRLLDLSAMQPSPAGSL